jgi:lysine 6-dehydrogenase
MGGVGAMANETTRDLVATSRFDEITIADIDTPKAERFAVELKDKRVKVVGLDANEVAGMVKLMKGYDMVANGLPRVFLEKATAAAIEAGVNITDLISPSAETLSMDEKAKAAGISAVGGVGITPGITNILARLGADKFTDVEQIDIDFAAFRSIAHSPGLLHVILWEFDPRTETRYTFENNHLIPHPPFSGARVVNFPEPIGKQTTYYVPHGESRTLSKNIPGVKRVYIRGAFPADAMRLVRSLYDYGIYNAKPMPYLNTEISPLEFLEHYLLSTPEGDRTDLWGYSIQVEVIGFAGNKKKIYKCQTSHPPMEAWGGTRAYDKNVGIPLSIGAQIIADGKVLKKGVDGAENMLPAQPFVDELKKRGFIIAETFRNLD